MDQRVSGIYGLARGHFGARSRSLECPLGIRSQPACLRPLLVDRQTVLPGTHSADDTALVRPPGEGGHGDPAGWRGRDSKFSNWPLGSGVLAVFPVIYTSIMVILHLRVGGPATAAVLANAVPGLAGFGAALLTLHLTAVPLGSALALIVALGVSVAWNAGLYAARHRESFA